MEDFGELLKKSYEYLNSGNLEGAKKGFDKIYNYLSKEELKKGENSYNYYLSAIIGLGVINMQSGKMESALDNYLEGYKISEGSDFNILFNLGVVYTNLSDNENASKYLEKAKKINPNDPNLIKFLGVQDNDSNIDINDDELNKKQEIDKNFEAKVTEMIKKLK